MCSGQDYFPVSKCLFKHYGNTKLNESRKFDMNDLSGAPLIFKKIDVQSYWLINGVNMFVQVSLDNLIWSDNLRYGCLIMTSESLY